LAFLRRFSAKLLGGHFGSILNSGGRYVRNRIHDTGTIYTFMTISQPKQRANKLSSYMQGNVNSKPYRHQAVVYNVKPGPSKQIAICTSYRPFYVSYSSCLRVNRVLGITECLVSILTQTIKITERSPKIRKTSENS